MEHIEVGKGVFFDPVNHKYYEKLETGIRPIPGVSEVLSAQGLKTSSPFMKPKHLSRGSLVHKACYLDDCGLLVDDTVTEDILPYLDAYRQWKGYFRPTILEHEKPVYSEELDVAGTFDLLVESELFPSAAERMIDIKSGYPADWHFIQAAGYAILKYGSDWLKVVIGNLYLNPGRFKYKEAKVHEQMKAGEIWYRAARQHRENRRYNLWE